MVVVIYRAAKPYLLKLPNRISSPSWCISGKACLIMKELEVNQWIALDIHWSSSQSERAKNTIHCFSIYWLIKKLQSLTLLHFWGVFQFTQAQPLPSPHKQCWTRVSRIFFRFLTLYRVGVNYKKISKRMRFFKRDRRNDAKVQILQYCPEDFCPGLSESWFFEKSLFFSYSSHAF